MTGFALLSHAQNSDKNKDSQQAPPTSSPSPPCPGCNQRVPIQLYDGFQCPTHPLCDKCRSRPTCPVHPGSRRKYVWHSVKLSRCMNTLKFLVLSLAKEGNIQYAWLHAILTTCLLETTINHSILKNWTIYCQLIKYVTVSLEKGQFLLFWNQIEPLFFESRKLISVCVRYLVPVHFLLT